LPRLEARSSSPEPGFFFLEHRGRRKKGSTQ
jgi:hypothetical protein